MTDLGVVFDPLVDAKLLGSLFDVVVDGAPVGNGLVGRPWLEWKAESVHVRIRSKTWVLEHAPCASQVMSGLEDFIAELGL